MEAKATLQTENPKHKFCAGIDGKRINIGCASWQSMLKYYLLVLEMGSPEGKQIAKEELHRMALAADLYNESANTTQEPTVFLVEIAQ